MIWPSTVVEVLAATAPLVPSDSFIASVNGAHPHPSFSADDLELLDAVRWTARRTYPYALRPSPSHDTDGLGRGVMRVTCR